MVRSFQGQSIFTDTIRSLYIVQQGPLIFTDTVRSLYSTQQGQSIFKDMARSLYNIQQGQTIFTDTVSRFSQIRSYHCTLGTHYRVSRFSQIRSDHCKYTVGSDDFHRYGQIIVQYTAGSVDFHRPLSVDFHRYGQIIVQYSRVSRFSHIRSDHCTLHTQQSQSIFNEQHNSNSMISKNIENK